MKLRQLILVGLIPLLFCRCTPAVNSPTSTIRISITGISTNNVSVSWVIHNHSESRTLQLNHDSNNPWTVAYSDITPEVFDNVYLTIQNTAGNQVLLSGDSSVVVGSLGSEKTLELSDLGVPADLSGMEINDILEDNSGNLMYIIDVQNTTLPHQITMKDNDNNFDPGAWQILASNTTYFTVWIERDGLIIGSPKTYSTLIGDVDFSFGSVSW